ATAENLPLTEVGRVPNKYGIGWALASAPFYLIAKALVGASNLLGANSANDGFDPAFQIAQQLGHLGYASIGLFLLYRCMRVWWDADAAARAIAVGWLATPLLYYQSTNLSMSHSLVFTIVAASLHAAVRLRTRPDRLD